MKAVPIGISVLSLVPWSLGSNGMFWVYRFAREHGLGLQLVPMRGWVAKYLPFFLPERVLAYEGVWGTEYRRNLAVMRPCEKVVFMDACREQFPDAVEVGGLCGCVETRPMCGWDESKYLMCTDLVLDTWHVRERRVGYESVTSHPISFMSDVLRENRVRVIHFQTRRYAELQGFLRGEKNNFLTKTLGLVKKYQCCVPIIIEVPPHFLWPNPARVVPKIRDCIRAALST